MNTVKEQVHHVLKRWKHTRDNDGALTWFIWQSFYKDVIKDIEVFKVNYVNRTIPTQETISRIRRKLQNNHKELRGELYEDRHGVKQEKALVDLGYNKV